MMTFDQVYEAFAELTKEEWEAITAAVVEAQYDDDFANIGAVVYECVQRCCDEANK